MYSYCYDYRYQHVFWCFGHFHYLLLFSRLECMMCQNLIMDSFQKIISIFSFLTCTERLKFENILSINHCAGKVHASVLICLVLQSFNWIYLIYLHNIHSCVTANGAIWWCTSIAVVAMEDIGTCITMRLLFIERWLTKTTCLKHVALKHGNVNFR